MASDISEVILRFSQVVDYLGKSHNQAAHKLGVERATVSSVLSGTSRAGRTVANGMVANGLSVDWLLTGEGTMFIEQNLRVNPASQANIEAAQVDRDRANRMVDLLQNTLEKEQSENEALKQELVELKAMYTKLESERDVLNEAATYLGSKQGSEIPRPEELDEWSKRREQPDNKDEDSEKAEDKKQRASLKKGR